MMLYKIPIRLPISLISEICATHGVTTEMKAPEKNPYVAEKNISDTRSLANSQSTRLSSPDMKAEGARRLNRPMMSDRYAGAILPKMPPAFITARTTKDMCAEIERSWA